MIRRIIKEIIKIIQFERSQRKYIKRREYIKRRFYQGKPVRCRNRSEIAYLDLIKWCGEKKKEGDEWMLGKSKGLIPREDDETGIFKANTFTEEETRKRIRRMIGVETKLKDN